MASISIIFLLLSVSFLGGRVKLTVSSQINLGSSLSPTAQPNSWPSPSGRFAFGFYQKGSGFAVGIWLVSLDNKTVVWTANRDDPLVTSSAMLHLSKDGKLLLQTGLGKEKLIANATGSAFFASMLNSGNFVLYNKNSGVIWQSFDYPTHTIVGGQTLRSRGQLFSSLSETADSTGRYRLKMQDDGNLVLYPANTNDASVDAYWSSGTYRYGSRCPKCELYLNNTGNLHIMNDKDSIWTSNSGAINNDNSTTIYRATLDLDGIFRLYSHVGDDKGKVRVSTVWSPLSDACKVKSFCGFNSYCTFNDFQPYCNCLPGSDIIEPNQRSLGCSRNFSEAGCKGGTADASSYSIIPMENMRWDDHPYFKVQMPIEDDCSSSCLEDCNCGAAIYKAGYCLKHELPLRYVRRAQEDPNKAFFKVGKRNIKSKSDVNLIPEKPPTVITASPKIQILLITSGFTVYFFVAAAISSFFIFKVRVLRYKRLLENENLGLNEEVTLRLFSYHELKKATNDFKEELGKGSFGAVYKGTLYKGKKLVAVKRLEKLVEEGEREFLAEMRAIGRTHHRNLVRLLGYSAEDSKRLLVYEYMSNGSLAELLFKSSRRPDWNERVSIALDVARGILYLHEECEAPIIHCDIKPQNILMDDFRTAKISDFGLSKLLMADQTRTFTCIRGTRGYLAPEWYKNTPISVKADVYSYGVVLLEIVCCRRNLEIDVLDPRGDCSLYLGLQLPCC
ncbi:putative Receptor-like protein kinase 1 [Quillaja saponaria]|uniref:Receptor-like serine/threonine-protein kinase n=1 Tax=Quillaja saponaria TaxID=32244 RepID=A0AAD7PJF7_QUISA|nr:putative Receptor-like protein kinase 1 [Quillaja saponaria]